MSKNEINTLEADYIVLGAGTAGCVFARRLSDNFNVSVIAVEAGPDFDNDPNIIEPTRFFPLVNLSLSAIYMYQQQDLPNPDANNRTFQYTMGRGLGGGSSVNGGIWSRSQRETYERWEELAGPLWNPDRVIQNYIELERYNGETPNPDAHGFNGPINIRQPMHYTQASIDIVDCFASVSGFPIIPDDDYNNPDAPANGPFHRFQMTQFQDKTRGSSPRYFLGPDIVDENGYGVNGRKLLLLTRTTAVKLIYKNKSNKAIGVEVISDGKPINLYARQEIILSMGIHNASFLQRSGVGPADVLEEADVPIKFVNPNVGANMVVKQQITGVSFSLNNQPGVLPDDQQAIYIFGAYVPDPSIDENSNIRGFHSVTTQTGNSFGFNGVLLKPKSTGTLRIQSPDPFHGPLVQNGMLSDPRDLASLMAFLRKYVPGITTCMNAKGYPTVQNMWASVLNDDNLLANAIRNNITLNFELWQCSCRMNNDPALGVANGFGKVYGIKNVRVGDASASPESTDGVPQAPAYLIGHTLSKEILSELNNRLTKSIKPKKSKSCKYNKCFQLDKIYDYQQ